MKTKVSLDYKMAAVVSSCSRETQRFALLVYVMMTSENQPEDPDEFLRIVLSMSQPQIDVARIELAAKTQAWIMVHGSEKVMTDSSQEEFGGLAAGRIVEDGDGNRIDIAKFFKMTRQQGLVIDKGPSLPNRERFSQWWAMSYPELCEWSSLCWKESKER